MGRVLSWRGFCLVVALLNLVLLNALIRKKPAQGGRKKRKGVQKAASLGGALVGHEEEEEEVPKVPSKLPPIGAYTQCLADLRAQYVVVLIHCSECI